MIHLKYIFFSYLNTNDTTWTFDLLGYSRARNESSVAFLWFEYLLLHPGDCNKFLLWLSLSTWLQLLQFLHASHCFWENIITLNVNCLKNTKYLFLTWMNFDKGFGYFLERKAWFGRTLLSNITKQLGFCPPTGNSGLKLIRSCPCWSWANQKSPCLLHLPCEYNWYMAYRLWKQLVILQSLWVCVLYLTLFLTEAVRIREKYFCSYVVDSSESTTATNLAIIWIIANMWEEYRRSRAKRKGKKIITRDIS